MRVLHTSDWHLGKNLEGRDRHKEQEDFIEELSQIVKDEKIDLVLIAGDIFDTYNPPALAEQLFCNAIDILAEGGKRGIVVIAGNHDNPDRLCAVETLAQRQGIFLLGLPASEIHPQVLSNKASCVNSGAGWIEISVPGCEHNAVILTLPYPSEARLKEVMSLELDDEKMQQAYSERVKNLLMANSQNFRKDTVNLLMSHIYTAGGKISDSERSFHLGGACTVYPDALPSEVQYAALGHLHRPQRVKADVPAYYSGSPLAYSFSEANQTKSVYIVDISPGGQADVKSVHLNSGKPLVRWVAKGGVNEVLEWCEEGRNMDAWIELEIYLKEVMNHQELALIKKAHPGIIAIRPVFISEDKDTLSAVDRSGVAIDELFKQFYMTKSGGTLPGEDLMNLFLELLNEDQEESEKEVETVS
ncbi:MAG: hypothetical protein APF76_03595 [Desulfitibacter sp. BRH_c19]|nr:MAG: hypothetical protein APF76_03595 [Desulfitibacter sp. BRH_c19]